ncbi:MAG: A/G-specific adenine glycosylase [Oscillibacter sp.]|nr:A/G-specific adenine glycosylase [Oscillibacter sp.]
MTSEERLLALRGPLLDWYRRTARDLPWRHTEDPYRIWVSEIMLQQTRVAAVLGYYGRFLEEFPTVEALAAAPKERLLKLWEGLGYYSRARNLQKAAAVVAHRYGGAFPADYETLLTLPGVGPYTAAAIASAAFGEPVPAVDGNVLRIVSRITDCHDDISAPAAKSAVRTLMAAAMPDSPADCRIFNQAAMELGAVVCVPAGPPECARCPGAELCLARARGTAPELPVKAAKKPRRVEERTVFVLAQNGRVALRRREKNGLLAGLWEFPNVLGTLDEAQAAAQLARWGLRPEDWLRRRTARHIFTHVEWRMTGYVLRAAGDGGFLWADRAALAERAVPSAFAAYLREAEELLPESDGAPPREGERAEGSGT